MRLGPLTHRQCQALDGEEEHGNLNSKHSVSSPELFVPYSIADVLSKMKCSFMSPKHRPCKWWEPLLGHVTSKSPIKANFQHMKTRKSQFCRNNLKPSPIHRIQVKTIFPQSDRQRHLLTTGGTKSNKPGRRSTSMEPTENVFDWRQLNQFTQFLPIAMKMFKKQMETRQKQIKKKSSDPF